MKYYRIRSKLLAGLFIIVMLLVAVSLFIFWQQFIMEDASDLLRRMDTIDRYLLECRRQEKNFLLRQDQSSLKLFSANFESLLGSTVRLGSEASDPAIKDKLARLIEKETAYSATFQNIKLDLFVDQEREALYRATDLTVQKARECHALVAAIRQIAISKLKDAQALTYRVSISSIVLGILLCLVISWALTQNIVKPLETLQKIAQDVSTGDIQDMDVEFSDLEMKRFTSRETYDLVRALQRMVTNMRHLVSSERGLMGNYHMTILVLVNRAVGSAAWSLIEKARAAADFASFSEVSPLNVDRFTAQLEKEASVYIDKERVQMLIQAIRQLGG